MELAKTCPHCAKQMTYQEKRAHSSWFGVPKAVPCPRCGTRLRWNADDWRLFFAGALVFLVGVPGLLVTLAQGVDTVTVFDGALVVGAAVMLVGVLRLRLERVDAPRDGG